MTRTEKYNFKLKYKVCGPQVTEHYEEESEVIVIDKFEESVLNLLSQNKQNYSMIELGSNHAYYSLLFNSILKKYNKGAINIMIEPDDCFYPLGVEHFSINDRKGHFYKSIIGKNKKVGQFSKEKAKLNLDHLPLVSFEELFSEHKLTNVDILHCDIQGHEVELLEEYLKWFEEKRFNYIFIATHEGYRNAHTFCKKQFNSLPYQLEFEEEKNIIGGDSFLIYKMIEV